MSPSLLALEYKQIDNEHLMQVPDPSLPPHSFRSYLIYLLMLVPLLLVAAATSVRAQVAGISASSEGLNINFDINVYESTLNNIAASVNAGPNRTVQDSIPVQKIYGVNVSRGLLGRDSTLRIWRCSMEIGLFPSHGECE